MLGPRSAAVIGLCRTGAKQDSSVRAEKSNSVGYKQSSRAGTQQINSVRMKKSSSVKSGGLDMTRNNGLYRDDNIRKLSIIGLLSAITIVLGLTGYGFIPLPIAKATIMHIPVVIGAIIEGPIVGMVIGLCFGLFSLIQNITNPTSVLSFAFINPLVSVLPRVLIGLGAYYGYKLFKIRNESIRIGFGTAVGTAVNTLGVLTMIYLLYAAQFAEKMGEEMSKAAGIIYGIALTNGIPEIVVSVLITIPVVMAAKKIKKR